MKDGGPLTAPLAETKDCGLLSAPPKERITLLFSRALRTASSSFRSQSSLASLVSERGRQRPFDFAQRPFVDVRRLEGGRHADVMRQVRVLVRVEVERLLRHTSGQKGHDEKGGPSDDGVMPGHELRSSKRVLSRNGLCRRRFTVPVQVIRLPA